MLAGCVRVVLRNDTGMSFGDRTVSAAGCDTVAHMNQPAAPSGQVTTEVNQAVAVLTLHSPPMNSLTQPLMLQLGERLAECQSRPDIRAVVVQGAGTRAFSAGSDIGELEELISSGPEALAAKFALDRAVFGALSNLHKPTVAAIEGAAIGGGLELAVCCDFIVAAQNAKLLLPEIRLGVFPGSGGTVRVTRRIGAARAKRMMLLGEPVDPATAVQWGLVDEISEGPVIDLAMRMAQRLAAGPARAIQGCKASIRAGIVQDEESALDLANRWAVELGFGSDAAEGMRAFREKRQPTFRETD